MSAPESRPEARLSSGYSRADGPLSDGGGSTPNSDNGAGAERQLSGQCPPIADRPDTAPKQDTYGPAW